MARQPLFSFGDLAVLMAIYESGSISAAANRLGVTPSALSHRIHELEARIGVSVTERRGQVRLSHEATRWMPRIEHILQEMDRLTNDVVHEETVGRLAVSNLFMEEVTVRAAIVETISAHPSIAWEVSNGHSVEIETGVQEGRVDVGFIRLERLRPGLHYDVVTQDRLLAVAKTGVSTTGRPEDWRWVGFSSRMGHGHSVRQALQEAGRVLTSTVQVDSFAMALALVHQGAVAVLPWSVVRESVRLGIFTEVQVDDVWWPIRRSAVVTRPVSPSWTHTLVRALRRQVESNTD